MNALAIADFSERLPTEIEIANADQLRQIVASSFDEEHGATINVALDGQPVTPVTLTPALARTFLDVLRLVSSGRGFRVIPVEANLTTQMAADILNVSRPYLIKLLDEKRIDYETVGRHRRIKASDLFRFKAERDALRRSVLSDLIASNAKDDLY
jgi:excisionase family DNA binding protein